MQNRLLVTLMGMLMAFTLLAQPKINSPLSRFGIGDDHSYNGHFLNLSGGLFGGYADANLVNVHNPASLGYLRSTAFDVGFTAGTSDIQVDEESGEFNQGNLEHLTLAFPLRNSISEVLERKQNTTSWSMGFDLRAKTRVGYSVAISDTTSDLGAVSRSYEGRGGTYELGWLNAYRYKNFSVGLDIGLFFGNISANRTVIFEDQTDALRNIFEDDINLNGFRWRLGTQYRFILNKDEENENRKRYFTIGMYGHAGTDFTTTGTKLYHGLRVVTGIRDTLINESGIQGSGHLPGAIGFGFVYEPDLRWELGANLEYSDWENYESEDFGNGGFGNALRIGAGVSFLPDQNAFGRYFQRVAYKAGFQYIQDGRTFNGDAVSTTKVHAGMTMPFYYLRQISFVHLGFEYRKTSADFITEDYFGLTLSATFNDNSWFLKRKFN
ncbi:MAG: hypothetical protein R3275_04565 [Saprospiraceae bacterium]|nr:hypothetical protein [Saprospiraceae bacterium]